MNDQRRLVGGSRFLYDAFDANAARIETVEKVSAEKWASLDRRLAKIEAMIDRLERRIWLAVFGVLTAVMAQWVSSVVVYGQ